jgi:predicted transcriptional regulator
LLMRPMRQSEVCAYAVKESLSMKQAVTVFYWLRDRGFIQKTSNGYCSPYQVTEKGQMFYGALIYSN